MLLHEDFHWTDIFDSLESNVGQDAAVEERELEHGATVVSNEREAARVVPRQRELNVSWKFGVVLIAGFFTTFIVTMVLRGVLSHRPILFSLFSNLYLAGTIIFGGGPVVVPLLRQCEEPSPSRGRAWLTVYLGTL